MNWSPTIVLTRAKSGPLGAASPISKLWFVLPTFTSINAPTIQGLSACTKSQSILVSSPLLAVQIVYSVPPNVYRPVVSL